MFGADNILWVEGKTEEICFPKIVEATNGISLMGTVIASVKDTGSFQTKDAKNTFDIYSKLSQGKSLIPPAVGFIFDREDRTETSMKDLGRQSGEKVEFLDRKLFENYLLNIDAITAVLNSNDQIKVAREQLIEWMEKNKWNKKYIEAKYSKEGTSEIWQVEVHGANLLTDVFKELTEGKLEFSKIKHSVALCDWIIENSIEDLEEIQSILRRKLTTTL